MALFSTRITPLARAFLNRDRPVAVLHVFPDVINLTDNAGEVLALQRAPAVLAPFGWEWAGAWPTDVNAASAAQIAHGQLQLGRGWLDPGDTALWPAIPAWPALRALSPALLQPARTLPPDLAEPLLALTGGLATRDVTVVTNAAGALLGRGPGLTPAGDDILVGVFHALAVWYPYATLANGLAAVPQPGRTTTLSLAFLRAAAAGAAAQPWHDLCLGLPGAHARLLASGSTSGRDAWTGFAAAAVPLRTLKEEDG